MAWLGSPGVSPNSCSLSLNLIMEILRFTVLMVLGAIVTKVWVPKPVDIWGHSRSLEDLGLGKHERKRMQREEWDHWRAFAPRSPRS